MLSRHITSEGGLTDRAWRRAFDGEQKVLFRATGAGRCASGPSASAAASGSREVETMAGVQDEASQFVQLTWLFTHPARAGCQLGRAIELPLAISRKLRRWTYDVVAEERLRFPFGELPTYFPHQARRGLKGSDLTAKSGSRRRAVPASAHLIRQNQDSWIDPDTGKTAAAGGCRRLGNDLALIWR